jgi:nucleoside phosphorylase/CheY-like chemotaxis protein
MISVLIVDDDPQKVQLIRRVVEKAAESVGTDVQVAANAFDAGNLMAGRAYDLMILDILLPVRRGEEARPDGGVKVLESLKSAIPPRLPSYIVGLTAYGDLLRKYAPQFGEELWFVVRFESASTEWEHRIANLVEHIASLQVKNTDAYGCDLGIVTALHKVELEAVLGLEPNWRETRRAGDDCIYHEARFERSGRSLSVVAAAAVEMGMCAAVSLSMNLISQFRPRVLAMVGVAAGVKGNPGDILIADQSWDYGSGKSTETEAGTKLFLPEPNAIPLSQELRHKINWFALRQRILEDVQRRWDGKPYEHKLAVHIGPIASGAAVLADRSRIEAIVEHNRKLIGVEMEIYGVYQAARNCVAPRPLAIAMKSICDFGRSDKSDEFKSYAAFTSARYLYEFALQELAR